MESNLGQPLVVPVAQLNNGRCTPIANPTTNVHEITVCHDPVNCIFGLLAIPFRVNPLYCVVTYTHHLRCFPLSDLSSYVFVLDSILVRNEM